MSGTIGEVGSPAHLRVIRFKTSPELQDAKALFDAEFASHKGGVDRELSIYVVSADRVAQVQLEHNAYSGMSAPRAAAAFDLKSCPGPTARPSETDSPFRLIRSTHHVIPLDDEDAAMAIATAIVQLPSDKRPVVRATREELKLWLVANAEVREWAEFLKGASSGWRKLATPPES